MLLVLVKGDSCLEPIQGGVIAGKPRGPCYKVVLCTGPFPPTFSSPSRPCGINHLLFSYLFNLFLYTVSFHMADTIALVVQILKQQQNLPMNLFPSKLLSHFHPVTTPLPLPQLPHLFIPRLSAAQYPAPPWIAHSWPTNSSKLFLLASLVVTLWAISFLNLHCLSVLSLTAFNYLPSASQIRISESLLALLCQPL